MFDGIKIEIIDSNLAEQLRNSTLLEFDTLINLKTGEVKGDISEKYQENLVFKIYPSGRVEITGSLHKHRNDGEHNYNDFHLTDVAAVILDLQTKFNIDPSKARVRNLEFGVNVKPSFNVNTFINNLVVYKNDAFNKMTIYGKGNGRDVEPKQYRVKIYNKGLQYGRPENILRFEKRINKMQCLGWGAVYLSDLTNPIFATHCLGQLTNCFNNVTVREKVNKPKMSPAELKTFNLCSNPLDWKLMTPNQRCINRVKFKAIIDTYGTQQLHAQVKGLVIEKGGILIDIPEPKSVCSYRLFSREKRTYSSRLNRPSLCLNLDPYRLAPPAVRLLT